MCNFIGDVEDFFEKHQTFEKTLAVCGHCVFINVVWVEVLGNLGVYI